MVQKSGDHDLESINLVNNGINYRINWRRISSINSMEHFCSVPCFYFTVNRTSLVVLPMFHGRFCEHLSVARFRWGARLDGILGNYRWK